MAILAEHYHNGTIGATATAAGEGYDGSAGTATYVAGGVSGGVSVRYPSGTVHHRDDVTAAYIMFAFTPGAVTGSTTILRTATTGDTSLSSIRILSTGALTIWSGLSSQVDTTATGVIVAGTTYYASMFTGSSTQELRLYSAAGTLLDTLTGAAIAGTAGRYYVGHGHGGASTDATDIDQVIMADAWLAPTSNINLVLADSLSSSTFDNVALTQKNTLVVADATSSSQLDALTLKVKLVTADSTSGSTIDNLALTQKHILTIADARSTSTLDNTAPTQKHILVVQDALSSSSVESTVLSQSWNLTIQELLSSSTLDATALTQEHTLTVQDLLSSSALENIDLELATNLVIQDATSSSLLDNVALTQKHTLTISGMRSSSAVDSIRLSILVESRSYYIDSDGNVYWVTNQSLGLVEKV